MSDTHNIKIRNKAKRKLALLGVSKSEGNFFHKNSQDEDNKINHAQDEFSSNGKRYGINRKYHASMKVHKRRKERKRIKQNDKSELYP